MFVGSAVPRQQIFSIVRAVTAWHRAFVRLDACMSSHMVISVPDHCKFFGAERARIWFHLSMNTTGMNLKLMNQVINNKINLLSNLLSR